MRRLRQETYSFVERLMGLHPAPFYLTEHGFPHVEKVLTNAGIFSEILGLSEKEQKILEAAALLHDIGNAISRKAHHACSVKLIAKMCGVKPPEKYVEECPGDLDVDYKLSELTPEECEAVMDLVYHHRRKTGFLKSDEVIPVDGSPVRIGLLRSVLRVSDALDIDRTRAQKWSEVKDRLPPESVPHWLGHLAIESHQVDVGPGMKNNFIRLLVKDYNAAKFKIHDLADDVYSSELGKKFDLDITLVKKSS